MTPDSLARRRIIIASVSFAVILLSAVAAYFVIAYVLRLGQQVDPASDQPTSALQTSEAAQELYVTEGATAAITAYDHAIVASESDQETAELKLGKATVLFNEDDLDDALVLAIESHELHRTRFSAALVADIYRAQGDETSAGRYYSEAIGLVGEDGLGDLPLNDEAYYRERLESGDDV